MQFNQAMIREREEGMKEIEATMTEVNEIFRDLSTLVHEQGSQLGKKVFREVKLKKEKDIHR